MKLKQLAPNQTEVTIDGMDILFSYQTPVAAVSRGLLGGIAYITGKKWSRTTSKHINQWLASKKYSTQKLEPQIFFDNLAEKA
jgi:hypothetical protein